VPVGVRFTANFERNLAAIERFLLEAEEPQAFDALVDELLGTVIPNLERFSDHHRAAASRDGRLARPAPRRRHR
jgi:hypothetical protein